jgi:hypothetical protein
MCLCSCKKGIFASRQRGCRSDGDSGSARCRLASDVIHEVAEQEGMVGDDLKGFIRASSLPAVPWPFVVGSVATTGGILTTNARP